MLVRFADGDVRWLVEPFYLWGNPDPYSMDEMPTVDKVDGRPVWAADALAAVA